LNLEQNNPTLNPGGLSIGDSPEAIEGLSSYESQQANDGRGTVIVQVWSLGAII